MTKQIQPYVIELARADCATFNETLASATPKTINEALWAQAYTNVDLGSLDVSDREAYVTACKAILTGIAA